MPTDYYPEPDDQTPEGEVENTESEDTGESGSETALIPKSVLGGKEFKPGEEVVLKVTHVYEDEVAVEYAPEKPSEEPELAGDDEFDMMEKGESHGVY